MRLRELGDVYYTVQGIEGVLFGCISGNLHGMLRGQPVVKFGMAVYGPSYRSSFEQNNTTRILIIYSTEAAVEDHVCDVSTIS